MKTFKQHLNDLEKKRKSKGYFPNVVHGSHASKEENDGKFPNVVHGSHASKEEKLKEDVFSDGYLIYNKNKEHLKALQDYETGNHRELEQHYSELRNHPDVNHLIRYTSASKALNRKLIRGEELTGDLKDRAEGINRVLNDASPIPQDTTVFSGLGFDPRNHMTEDGHLISNSYLSSSTRGIIAHSFSTLLNDEGIPSNTNTGNTHTLKIDLPKGSKYGAYIDHISNHRGENEFLFPPGTKFKLYRDPEVREVEYDDPTSEDGQTPSVYREHIWHAIPVGQNSQS